MQTTRPRVLVIDDERTIRDRIAAALARDGFEVRGAVDAGDGIAQIRAWEPALILLDLMMPKIDGLALIPQLRCLTDAPVVVLTARGDDRDPADLSARIRSALRAPAARAANVLRFADLAVDLETRTVTRGGRAIPLSRRELGLLVALIRRPGRVFSRDELLAAVWGVERGVTPGNVETYISYLRAKIDAPFAVKLIRTVRGVGYALRER